MARVDGGTALAENQDTRDSIIRSTLGAARSMVTSGLVAGTAGNVSARLPDGNVVMTPASLAYETMCEEDLVISGLEETMSSAYQQLLEVRQRYGSRIDLRTAAFICSIDKIATTYGDLGIFP